MRGKGRPSSVKPRPVETEIAGMESLIEKRISVELAAPRKANSNSTDVVDIKPNFYGIGLNLNEACRRLKKWLSK